MVYVHETIEVKTTGQGLYEVTRQVANWVTAQSIDTGLLNLFCRHTSASLLIQENADPDVLTDLNAFFSKLVPEGDPHYLHRSEGSDDMPAHIRSALTQSSLSIPVRQRCLALGTWQGIYLFEHRSRGRPRELMMDLVGD